MESYEVLRKAVSGPGVKAVAAEMGVSTSLVYKWTQAPSREPLDGRSGARNPLDRVRELVRITGDAAIVSWLCAEAGGVFVANPPAPEPERVDSSVIANTQEMLREFSDVLDEVSRALGDEAGIDAAEAARIRREWEELKAKAEGFVLACEAGSFDKRR